MNMLCHRLIKTLSIVIFIFCSYDVGAQDLAIKEGITLVKRRNAYIDVNKADPTYVYSVFDGVLSLEYHDAYGFAKFLFATVYNWKQEAVARYQLTKSFGSNSYLIDMNADIELEGDETYRFEMIDEAGKGYTILFRGTPIPPTTLDVEIFVNPLHVECESQVANLVEFYAMVSKGRAPYTINWYVISDSQSDLLYQPKNEVLSDSDDTSVIQVDHPPAYYVLLDVTDACGNTGRRMVLMQCEAEKRSINTIFVEPLNQFQSPSLKGN